MSDRKPLLEKATGQSDSAQQTQYVAGGFAVFLPLFSTNKGDFDYIDLSLNGTPVSYSYASSRSKYFH